LLLSLCISKALTQSNLTFTARNLNDITLGDTFLSLGEEITTLQIRAAKVDLSLNISKREIIGFSEEARSKPLLVQIYTTQKHWKQCY